MSADLMRVLFENREAVFAIGCLVVAWLILCVALGPVRIER